jgi:Domain of unknown function (DUF1906)
MSVAVVFQHHNDAASTFESEGRGKIDAERSLELASSYAQPKGSAIYFGVDGVDAKFFSKFHKLKKTKETKYGLDLISRYFNEINSVTAGTGYKIGVYSSVVSAK